MRLGPRFVLILLVALVIGCGGPAATPTPVPPTQAPQATDPPPTQPPQATQPPSSPTAGELAELGSDVYAASCAGCHGDSGQGVRAPAVVGSGFRAARYGNAQALLDKISSTMPAGSPGSLSAEEYLQILAWLLVGNGYVQATDPLAEAQLAQVPLAP